MPTPIATGPVHHLRLTVSDIERSRAFYTEIVGFQFVMDLPSGVFLSNGAVGLGLGPSPEPSRAPANDSGVFLAASFPMLLAARVFLAALLVLRVLFGLPLRLSRGPQCWHDRCVPPP